MTKNGIAEKGGGKKEWQKNGTTEKFY